jgi:Tol biopolymer transport system component
MHRLIALAGVALTANAFAYQGGPPPTDVFLAPFSIKDGNATLGAPINISNSPGYDNQPSFTPDGRSVLFTSVRGDWKPDPANSAATGSDIYGYDIASRKLVQITSTPESEYSPTTTPDGAHISVIRVEADGTQRLWRFAADGTRPELVLRDVKPVGYHAWADGGMLALFVLGPPATLQLADSSTGQAEIITKDIGRSVSRVPGGGISYVQRENREGQPSLVVMQLNPKTRQTKTLVRVMPGPRDPDLAWTPDGLLLMAHGGKLYGWRPGRAEFTTVIDDLDALGLRNVTRLAVSPRGDWIAIVAQP